MRDEKLRLRTDDGYGLAALTNNLFSGTIYVGTGTDPVAQSLTVSFSIEGDLTLLSDSTCTTCGTGTLFDTSLSSSYDYENTTETTAYVGMGEALGYLVTDRICLDPAA